MDKDLFLQQMMVAGEDTPESYLKDDVDWVLENSLLAVKLLITGTVSLSDNCVSCTTLNNFKSNKHLHWDWKPDSAV